MATTIPPVVAEQVPPAAQKRSILRRIIGSYSFRVIIQGLITIWAVMTFTFFVIRLMPGNPIEVRIEQLLQQGITYEDAYNQASLLYQFDPNKPVFLQYVEYLGNLAQGNLGKSISSAGTNVTDQIARYLPWTLFSVGLGLVISFTLGILLGLVMAYWRGGILDNVLTVIASILYGIPDYVIPLLLIIVVGVQWGWFEPGELRGGVNPRIPVGFTPEYIGSILRHAILPVTTYTLASIGGWILTMKSSTLSTLGEDYITVAKARGLSEGRVLTAYVGRNAMLPLVTRLAISIGFIVGGSVIVEELFQYPGIGSNLLKAINARDYTTMQGYFLVIAISVVISNILADLAFGWLDPRVRLGEDRSK